MVHGYSIWSLSVTAVKTRRFEHGRYPSCRKATSNDVVYGGMARNAPCAKAARQRVSTECVYRRSTFASMSNTDSESDAERDADTKSVVVDESADSVVWDAVKPNARLRTRSRLETCQAMLVEYGNQGGDD